VAEPDGRWLPSSHVSIYDGRADGEGGSVWVYGRVHSRAGLHVEAHHHAPDGPLLRRTAVSHAGEAVELVDRLRTAMVRRGVEAVRGEVEPLVTRGQLIVHGVRDKYSSRSVVLDDGLPALMCAEFWLAPGVHRFKVVSTLSTKPFGDLVRRASVVVSDVTIEGAATQVLRVSAFRSRVHVGPPRFHWLCNLPVSARRVAD
jgi:hypothetical protein